MRLSPQDPQTFAMQMATAWATSSSAATPRLRAGPTRRCASSRTSVGACVAAAAAAHAGRMAEAERAMARLRELDPALRLGNLKDFLPFRRPEDFARWAEGLRLAGLPAGRSHPGLVIRRAGPADAAAVRALTRSAYAKWVPWSRRSRPR